MLCFLCKLLLARFKVEGQITQMWTIISCFFCLCGQTCIRNTAVEAVELWTWRWQSSSWAGPSRNDGTCLRSSGRLSAGRTTPSSAPPSPTADSERTDGEKNKQWEIIWLGQRHFNVLLWTLKQLVCIKCSAHMHARTRVFIKVLGFISD